MNDKRETLIRYRLEQADESLESAQLLLDNGKYRPSDSRSYYAISMLLEKYLTIWY